MLNVTKLQFYETIWKQRKAYILCAFLANNKSGSEYSFKSSIHPTREAVSTIAGVTRSRGDVKCLGGLHLLCIISINIYTSLALEAQPRCAQMLPKLGKSFCRAGVSPWAGEREGRRKRWIFTWFQVSQQAFCVSNSFQPQEPSDSLPTRSPKYWICMRDRSCQAEEWDFKAELKNRIMYLSKYRMCLLADCGKHLLVNHPALATFLTQGRGGEGRLWRQWSCCCFHHFPREESHLARSSQPGWGLRFSACSWLQLSARSLRTGCSPKVV